MIMAVTIAAYVVEKTPAYPPLPIKEKEGMKLLCKCGKYFEVTVYQELCPTCTLRLNKARAELHGMIFKA